MEVGGKGGWTHGELVVAAVAVAVIMVAAATRSPASQRT